MKEVKVFTVSVYSSANLMIQAENNTWDFIASDETEAILMARMWYKQEWERSRERMERFGFTSRSDDKPEIHHCDVKYSRTVIVMDGGKDEV